MRNNSAGFTLVEVLVAIVMLGVGVVALAGSSAAVTRMVGRGKMETRAAQAALRKVEELRLLAYSTTPRCSSGGFVSGGPEAGTDGTTTSWTVTLNGSVAEVRVGVTHRIVRGTHTDSLSTLIEC